MLIQTVRKYLVYEYVPIVENTFRSGNRESCVAQRSIYVILRGNEETRNCIKQVRSNMFSDRIYKCILIQNTKLQTSLFVLIIFQTPSKCKICVTVEK